MNIRPIRIMDQEAAKQGLFKAPKCACGKNATKKLTLKDLRLNICDSCEGGTAMKIVKNQKWKQ